MRIVNELALFATKGLDAFQVFEYWLGVVKFGIERVTLSLLPPHAINVALVDGIASTCTRIMAGYSHENTASVFESFLRSNAFSWLTDFSTRPKFAFGTCQFVGRWTRQASIETFIESKGETVVTISDPPLSALLPFSTCLRKYCELAHRQF